MPVVDGHRLRFIYWNDPTRIIDHHGVTLTESEPGIAADHFRGSSQAISFADGWLAVVHWVQHFDGWPKYRHRFAWYDRNLRLKKVSPGWVFAHKSAGLDVLEGYEYCTGLCWHPDGKRLVLGYHIHEREAWVGTVNADEVANTLRSRAGESAPDIIPIYRNDIGRQSAPDIADVDWAFAQTNRALLDSQAVDRATRALVTRGLPEHPDHVKNWDTWIALTHALRTCRHDDHILDAGGDRNSAFLPDLAALGYKSLLNINLRENDPERKSGIDYAYGDITVLAMASETVRFINCQSVLEHAVDWRRFLTEAARILTTGGQLFVSVDFWETPISTSHVVAEGYAGDLWKIFAPQEIQEMIEYAKRSGLILVGEMDLKCHDRVVQNLGCGYTFCNLLFCRDGHSTAA
jgi:hypothetical protein